MQAGAMKATGSFAAMHASSLFAYTGDAEPARLLTPSVHGRCRSGPSSHGRYTEETPLYGTLNYTMRTPGAETDAKIKHKFADYIRHTMNAASGLPNFVGKVYRGIDAHLKAATYAVGRTITWQSFSSSSRSQVAARGFVQTLPGVALSGSLFVIEANCAKKIEVASRDSSPPLDSCPLSRVCACDHFHPPRSPTQDFSAIPSEEEVLFLPNSQFKVSALLESQAHKVAALEELSAYNMDSLHVYVLTQLS